MLNLCKIFEKVSIFIYSNDINCCKEAIMKRYVIIDYLLRNNIIEQELEDLYKAIAIASANDARDIR